MNTLNELRPHMDKRNLFRNIEIFKSVPGTAGLLVR